MKKNLSLGPYAIKELYLKNKDIIIPLFIILVSAILLFKFVMPQISSFVDSRSQRDEALKQLAILQDNYNYVSGLNDSVITSDTDTLTKALPLEKDFGGVLSAISSASIKSGVAVGNFEFQVGDITKPSTNVAGKASMQLLINVQADSAGVINFLNRLSESLPISEVTSIDFNGGNAGITVLFYYRPFNKETISDTSVLKKQTKADEDLIVKLSGWKDNESLFTLPIQGNATPSAAGSPF